MNAPFNPEIQIEEEMRSRGRGPHRHRRGRGTRGQGEPDGVRNGRGGPPPFGGGGRGRRGGPQRRPRGDVRLALLALLGEQPRHGYELMQEIGERTSGVWTPSPGSVYPSLQALQDEGLITIETDESNRSVARLTKAGEEYIAEHAGELETVWDTATGLGSDAARAAQREMWSKLHGLVQAMKQVREVGTAPQIAEAAVVIEDTQRALYAILAKESRPTEES